MTNIWVLVVPALIVAYIGTKITKPDADVYSDWKFPWGPATGSRIPGKILFLIGATCSAVGLYSAFLGPVQIGSTLLPNSPAVVNAISSFRDKKSAMSDKYSRKEKKVKTDGYDNDPSTYAQKKVKVTGHWSVQGRANCSFDGMVINGGHRYLKTISLQIKCKDGANFTITVPDVAPGESKQYSQGSTMKHKEQFAGGPYIIGATYK